MGKFTYKYLGDRDLKDAKILLDAGSYTASGRLSQQSLEKNMKHWIELQDDMAHIPLLSTHNIVKMYGVICDLGGLVFDKHDRNFVSLIKDYYFDMNYPGEGCRELNKEEAKDAYDFVVKINELLAK
ncbi:MAG: HEPN domain-containing protein [Defluviitaleaceae bacterium]|nr:HEPN domain-containing protein [Defluviitaleaceae bacterium]